MHFFIAWLILVITLICCIIMYLTGELINYNQTNRTVVLPIAIISTVLTVVYGCIGWYCNRLRKDDKTLNTLDTIAKDLLRNILLTAFVLLFLPSIFSCFTDRDGKMIIDLMIIRIVAHVIGLVAGFGHIVALIKDI